MGITIMVSTPYMDEASMCDRIALIQEGHLMSVETPFAMMQAFAEDLWAVRSKKIYHTSKLLGELPSMISVNSFGQVLHLVTPKGIHTPQSIKDFLATLTESEVTVEPALATIEDVFILLMNNRKTKS